MYKVCILAAGKGTRNTYVKTNKALLQVNNLPVISRILYKSLMSEVVIALGYKSQEVMDYVKEIHSTRSVTFVEVDNYEGEGSGPGYSLLACKEYLQCPFIFTACDTLVLDGIPEPTKNWIGIAPAMTASPYLLAEVRNGYVSRFFDKWSTPDIAQEVSDMLTMYNNAFIGLAGVKDYEAFWEGLSNPHLVQGEHQVTDGLNALIPKLIAPIPFTWFDTGSDEGYERANKYFSKRK